MGTTNQNKNPPPSPKSVEDASIRFMERLTTIDAAVAEEKANISQSPLLADRPKINQKSEDNIGCLFSSLFEIYTVVAANQKPGRSFLLTVHSKIRKLGE